MNRLYKIKIILYKQNLKYLNKGNVRNYLSRFINLIVYDTIVKFKEIVRHNQPIICPIYIM